MKATRIKRVVRLLLILGVVYLSAIACLAFKYVHPTRFSVVKPAGMEVVDLTAAEGDGGPIRLWVKRPNGPIKGAFVLVHGYGGSPTDWTGLSQVLASQGYLCVIPHMPGHAESPDNTVQFGDRESKVVVASALWVKKHAPKARVMAHGLSLGGASVWLAAERRPDLFAAIGSEGAFPNFAEASQAYLGPGATILAPVIPLGSRMEGVDTSTLVPERAAASWRGKPALVIHGENDKLFPRSFGERLAKAAGVKLWLVPRAEHAKAMRGHLDEIAKRLVLTIDGRLDRQ
ncbi:MAG: alpha/beta hydrolase [Fimbriimonas sp.]